jgi:RNA polymerase sigma factor (sigma-70 family)
LEGELLANELIAATPKVRMNLLTLYSGRKTRNDIEDVLQTGLLKAWRSRDRFRYECAVATWLTTICIREMLQVLRKQRMEFISLDGLDFPIDKASAEQRLLEIERKQFLLNGILDLPPLLRSSMLNVGLGKPARSGAEKTRRFKGRHRLREMLNRDEFI